MAKTRWPTKADYERQRTLKFKKGTRVRVTRAYQTAIDAAQETYDKYIDHSDAGLRAAARAALAEKKAYLAAVGKVRKVVAYTIGANPHGIRVNSLLIFLPTECLEAV